MSGWVKLHRALSDWQWANDPNTFCLFIHILLMAQHSPSVWRNEQLLPGQLLTGRKKLSAATGLSEQSIRTSLNRLKSTNEVTIKKTNKYSVISITNWDKYQGANQQTNQQLTIKQPATNHIQECKKKKNDNNKDFDLFWEEVPNKKSKGQARKAYKTALTKTTDSILIDSMRKFASAVKGKDTKYIPHPSTWLNGECWDDEETKTINDFEKHLAEVIR
tara:strand:- start:38 stop:694 length:657 start_codon:yes stop_codon:yes gene_type:complete